MSTENLKLNSVKFKIEYIDYYFLRKNCENIKGQTEGIKLKTPFRKLLNDVVIV